MSFIRPRRVLAVATALVMALTGVPLLAGAAHAATGVTPYDNPLDVLGPNAGFPGNEIFPESLALGVSGRTPLFLIDVAAETTIQSVEVRLSGAQLNFPQDWDAADAFALYKDTNGDGLFRKVDFDAGPVSTGFARSNPMGQPYTQVDVTAGSNATNATRYFLTGHPAASTTLPNRTFTARIPANGVRTSAGNLPSADVDTETLTLDSRPPTAPAVGNFTVSQQDAGTEDFYTVAAGEFESGDPDKRLVFLNDAASTSVSNVLTRTNGVLAVHQKSSATAAPMHIGDGTGITATTQTARNNQKSDTVYVRAFDPAGNLTAATTLSTGTTANDVTAPTYTTYTISVPAGITTANVTSGNVSVTHNLSATGVATYHSRLFTLGQNNQPDPSRTTAEVSGTGTTTSNPVGIFPERAEIWTDGYVADARKNKSDTVRSTSPGVKDLVQPQLESASLIVDAGTPNVIDPGDKVQIRFSEAMNTATILDTNGAREPCDPKAIPPSLVGPAECVNKRLGGVDPNTTVSVLFGTDPGFDWGPNGESATITVGKVPAAPESRPCSEQVTNDCTKMITRTHQVKAQAAVTDVLGNAITAAAVGFVPVQPLPLKAETADVSGGPRFAIGDTRDGTIDSVTITWNTRLRNFALDANSFRVNSNGDEIIPTSIEFVSGTTSTVKLNLTPTSTRRALWHGGSRPIVSLLANKTHADCNNAPAPCTGLQEDSGRVDVPALSTAADDKAPPAVQSVTTRDLTKDGRIDRLVIEFTEPIKHGTADENECGYTLPLSSHTAYQTQAAADNGCFNNAFAPIVAAETAGAITTLQLRPVAAPAYDTDVAPRVAYSPTPRNPTITNPIPLKDLAGNLLNSWNNTAAGTEPTIDGAGPVVTERKTRDRDADGKIDHIDVKFSEKLSGTSVGLAHFTVSEPTRVVTRLDMFDPTTVAVGIEEASELGAGDTDLLPKVRYQAGADGGLKDLNFSGPPNPAPDEASAQASTDGAGPAIMSASFNYSGVPDQPGAPTAAESGKTLKVLFSEPTNATPAADPTKFRLVQGTGAPASPTAISAAVANDRSRVLTFASVYSLFDAASVQLLAAGVVSDGASNASQQTAAVSFYGYPTAKLNLTGPAGSEPGHSLSRTFDTGMAGNDAVVGWLLVVQPASSPAPVAPTSPADPRFESQPRPTYTVETDGVYKAYLWTRDAVGNITHKDGQAPGSPVAEDTITVAATAPVISGERWVNVQNSQTPTRIRDGETVRALATVTATDADKWAPGCPVKHMSIDYRQVTSNSTKGAVAATACDLRSNPMRRELEFPFVTVAGTTHYPVGAVLRTGGSTDPGWILEDSESDGIVKRRFHSVTARRTWMIPDSAVIQVSSAVLSKYKTGPVKSYRDGALIRAHGSTTTWMIDWGRKRAVPGKYIMYYKFNRTMLYYVNASEINAVPRYINITGKNHPLGTYLKHTTNLGTTYFVVLRSPNGKLHRREVTNLNAVTTHVPAHHVVAVNGSDLALPLDAYVRGYRDGVLLRDSSNAYHVVSRGRPRKFASADIFNPVTGLGYSASYATAYDAAAIGRLRGETPAAGAPIDYTSMSAVIRVRNVAGLTTTKSILLKALGVVEPAPAWLGSLVPPRP